MTEQEFENRFNKAWSASFSENFINEINSNISKSPDPYSALFKASLDCQRTALKSVLKEFFEISEQ